MKKQAQTSEVVKIDDGGADERMVPEKHKGSGIYGEHIARYAAAEAIVKGKHVLDIASGSGYGTRLLADTAKSVVGVDVSPGAIQYASKHYAANNVRFTKSDGIDIPFDDDSFDVVVSFETIEHIEDYRHFMKEIKRVLKHDGILVLSTPNEREFTKGNHFHLHEFEHDELVSLARKYFKNITSYFQATWGGNLIGSAADMSSEWRRDIVTRQINPIPEEKYLYFYLLCSNRKITESVDTQYTISQHMSDKRLHEKQVLTDTHIANIEAMLKACEADNLAKAEYITNLEKLSFRHYVKRRLKRSGNR